MPVVLPPEGEPPFGDCECGGFTRPVEGTACTYECMGCGELMWVEDDRPSTTEDQMTDDIRIPKDPEQRKALYEMAGLTEEERAAVDAECFRQAEERRRQQCRALEKSADWSLP